MGIIFEINREVERMRTREMKLYDHGVPPEDEPKVRALCRTATGYDLELLQGAIASAAPGIEQPIKDSLTTGIGYVELSKKEYIPVTKADFYAYQRKALAEFYRMLRLLGRWKDGIYNI